MKKLHRTIFAVGVAAGVCGGQAAWAMEDTTPYMPGISIADPVGALPPPGIYSTTALVYFNMQVHNQGGSSIPVYIHDYNAVNQLLWVPKIPEILGANFGAFVVQPIRAVEANTPGGTFNAVGLENTIISPINLSWNLHNGFFVSAGLSLYPVDGTYTAGKALNASRNYYTTEPSLAVSYLADGWNLTLHTVFDINAPNTSNGYRSGNVFVTDYTAMHKFGAFELGFGGTWTQQISNDTINGMTVPAVANINGYGNRTSQFNIGPTLTYNFGAAVVKAYYLHDVYAANYPGGDRFYVKLELPLFVDDSKPTQVSAKY